MPATFPAYQNMISHSSDPAPILESAMRIYNATPDDVRITDVAPTWRWEQPQFKSRYTLAWDTYIGWKVYMYMTGCLASDLRYEPVEPIEA